MEPYDHHEDIVGIAFLVFCVFKGAVSPGVKRKDRQVKKKVEVSVLIVYILPLQKTSLLAARSRARISLYTFFVLSSILNISTFAPS